MRQLAPLVGRGEELAWLSGCWRDPGQWPRVAVVAGEAGVGKSRLAAELADALERDGVRVARARCYATRGELALGPVAAWLRTRAIRTEAAELEPVWRAEVGRLVPELGVGWETVRPAPLADRWQRHRFFEALARAVTGERRPTLLVLDDLQWSDADTLAFIEMLVHLQDRALILVVATSRSEEVPDHPKLSEWCRRLRSIDRLDELEMGPLGEQETVELATALTGSMPAAEERHRLLAETGGFPLLVVESLREDSAGRTRIHAVLSGRFTRLSREAEELVGLAAAAGRDVSLELLAEAGGWTTRCSGRNLRARHTSSCGVGSTSAND